MGLLGAREALFFNIRKDFLDPEVLFKGSVEFESEVREVAEAHLFRCVDGDEAGCRLERGENFGFFCVRADDADRHLCMVKISRRFNLCDSDKSGDVRIAHLFLDHFEDHLFEKGVDALKAIFLHVTSLARGR